MKTRIFQIAVIAALLVSCQPKSEISGWDYNSPKQGGFQKVPYVDQETGVGLILIEGQELTLPLFTGDTILAKIPSFYISKYQETNGQYCAYLDYIQRYYSHTTYVQALPDTTVWFDKYLSQDTIDYLVTNYLRGKRFHDYPVVGVNPKQIKKYAEWKTDRLNEYILIREGVIQFDTLIIDSTEVFTTETYYNGQYDRRHRKLNIKDLDPGARPDRRVRYEDGILLPRYRLPYVREWQLAALAIGDSKHTYIRTPKEIKLKLASPPIQSLKVNPLKSKHQPKAAHHLSIFLVYDGLPNNYGIYGLYDHRGEIVQDSVGFYQIGTYGANPPAEYCDTLSGDFKYRIPENFENPDPFTGLIRRPIGFRLAMDRVGSPIHDKMKRRKGK